MEIYINGEIISNGVPRFRTVPRNEDKYILNNLSLKKNDKVEVVAYHVYYYDRQVDGR
ncbi:hypothetical protein [Peribacillus muralis]|uniref:hypothetical protein n=1 Tax=Peribacillus muralis TaxID=264697 RepID=UPI003D0090BE